MKVFVIKVPIADIVMYFQKMVDNNQGVPSSSQESLPLSQETFSFLWDE